MGRYCNASADLRKPFLREVIEGRVCIAQNLQGFANAKKFRCFQPQAVLRYEPFCDDFGPMNLASVARFIELLDVEIAAFPACKIVYCVEAGRRAMTNAVFLLGCYMILKLGMSSEEVVDCFNWLDEKLVEPFRDATYSVSDFDLTLRDCWRGLERSKALGWVDTPCPETGLWGQIDIEEYAHYDDPLSWDLHEVIPRKFVAFRGPKDLGGRFYRDSDGFRQFSPQHYLGLFRELGVTTVIRLNEPEYDSEDFAAHGVAHHDLEFPDCTAPPQEVVDAFFAIVDAAPGAVAVHCKAGLGRTGTLIALYMMRSCGFSAREAMGWLRIMRPGSVIGEQQHYLAAVDAGAAAAAVPRGCAAGDSRDAPAAEAAAAAAAALAVQVAEGMARRCSVEAERSFAAEVACSC